MDKTARLPILLMALTMLIDFIGFGLILPQLPFWAQHLGADPLGIGMIITMYALAQVLFTPVLGKLSDRYGRRPVIIISLCIEALSLALTALSSTLPMLLVARFISGLGASNIGSAQAVVADVTSEQERARGMGFIGAAIGLGFVFGPALGGLLAPYGATLPFWITACVALLNAVLVFCFLPETRWRHQREEPSTNFRRGVTREGWQLLRYSPALLALILVNLIFTIAFAGMETILPLFTQHFFDWDVQQNGYIFAYVGILGVIMQGGLVRQLVKRGGERLVFLLGLVCFASGLISLAFSTLLAPFFLCLGLIALGQGAVTPTVAAMLTFICPRASHGETLGLSQGIAGIGRIIGPLFASVAYEHISPGAPLFIGGLLVLLIVVVTLPIVRAIENMATPAPLTITGTNKR